VQLQRAEAQLVADEGVFGSLTKVVEMGHGIK
jgi:argininosuccinate lyase